MNVYKRTCPPRLRRTRTREMNVVGKWGSILDADAGTKVLSYVEPTAKSKSKCDEM
jgi:hypothetical protein